MACTQCTPTGGGNNATATPAQSTAYTGLVEVTPDNAGDRKADANGSAASVVLVVYDRIANGWDMPPGPWGASDAIFSMRVTLRQAGDR